MLTTNELEAILDDHARWAQGAGGECADLSMADLRMADLSGANLRRANLRGANLRGANLRMADLSMADLRRANLSGADLSGADLSGADLSGANLRRANLSGADLSGADLSGATLQEARGILWAQCSWADHGQAGRMLTAARIGDETRCFCGCLVQATPEELREYIATHAPEHAASRTIAADFVLARIDEMVAARAEQVA